MKKHLLTLSLIAITALGNVLQAQHDGYFSSSNSTFEYRAEDEVLPALPRINYTEDQKAPIGSGLLVLTGLGLGYLTFRKKK